MTMPSPLSMVQKSVWSAYTLRDVLGHATLAMSNRYVRQAGNALNEATERAAAIAADAMAGNSRGNVISIEGRKHA